MLQTLDDYVGGAAVVLNESGRGSRLEYLGFGRSAPARVEQHAAEDRQGALL